MIFAATFHFSLWLLLVSFRQKTEDPRDVFALLSLTKPLNPDFLVLWVLLLNKSLNEKYRLKFIYFGSAVWMSYTWYTKLIPYLLDTDILRATCYKVCFFSSCYFLTAFGLGYKSSCSKETLSGHPRILLEQRGQSYCPWILNKHFSIFWHGLSSCFPGAGGFLMPWVAVPLPQAEFSFGLVSAASANRH